jgi:hypothetical protein
MRRRHKKTRKFDVYLIRKNSFKFFPPRLVRGRGGLNNVAPLLPLFFSRPPEPKKQRGENATFFRLIFPGYAVSDCPHIHVWIGDAMLLRLPCQSHTPHQKWSTVLGVQRHSLPVVSSWTFLIPPSHRFPSSTNSCGDPCSFRALQWAGQDRFLVHIKISI